MPPHYTMFDLANQGRINTERLSYLTLCMPTGQHFLDLSDGAFGQLGLPIIGTDGRVRPSADPFVPHVLLVSSRIEVAGAHACRVIALVAHKQTVWNWTLVDDVRKTVGSELDLADVQLPVPVNS